MLGLIELKAGVSLEVPPGLRYATGGLAGSGFADLPVSQPALIQRSLQTLKIGICLYAL